MSDLRINWIDEWKKKDVDLEELRRALESGDSARYSAREFRDIGAKLEEVCKARRVEPVPLKGDRGR